MIYEGDERWFSENSRIDGSRFWVWIDASSGKIIMSFVQATTAVNDLGSVLGRLGNCDGNKCTYPQSTSTNHILSYPVGEDGTIVLEYSVLCSHPTCYLGPGPDGNIAFIPNDTGSFYAVGITEKFPNLEAYYWEDGKLKDTLFRINHFSKEELANSKVDFETGLYMYGGFPFGEPAYYWDTMPWYWHRSHLGH